MANKFIIKLDDAYMTIDEGCEVYWKPRTLNLEKRYCATVFSNVTKEEVIKACEVLFDVKVEAEDV